MRRRNRRGNPTTLGRLGFRGPSASPSRPKVKLDLTSDEAVVDRPVRRPILHPYSDQPLPVEGVLSYSIVELLGEKLRALAERCGPRDLYDVVNMYRHPDLVDRAAAVLAALGQKSAYVGIAVPTAESIRSSPFRDEVEQEWANMLAARPRLRTVTALHRPGTTSVKDASPLGVGSEACGGARRTILRG